MSLRIDPNDLPEPWRTEGLRQPSVGVRVRDGVIIAVAVLVLVAGTMALWS